MNYKMFFVLLQFNSVCLNQSASATIDLCHPINPKNTNLVELEDIEFSVKFHWIPFSSFKGEVENVSANQRPGVGVLAYSCLVSSKSIKWFQRT